MLSIDVPPMATALQESAPSSDHQAPPTVIGLDEPEPMQWAAPTDSPFNHMGPDAAGYVFPVPFTPGSGGFCQYAQNDISYNDNYNLPYSTQHPGASCPRSCNGLDLTGLPNNIIMSESYPPAAYQIEPQKHHDAIDLSNHEINGQLMQLSNDYERHHYGSHVKVEEHSGYHSPYSDLTRASTPHDDPPRYPHNASAGEETTIDKEQPYAQLIYQALLQAPGKTMILRDIYDWFKTHTDKASASETKGWQNSIRHNLSMNGAFEKVDHPCEESRKGFMWRLTDEAIREGVKSTTRYRSKQPNKRGHRTQHPQPQRQASGAKGGQAARRSAKLRRSGRVQDAHHNDLYTSRSVPAPFDTTFSSAGTRMGIGGQYVQSPYYGSEGDIGYASKNDDFGSPLLGGGPATLDISPPAASYTGSPMSQHGLSQPQHGMTLQGLPQHGMPIGNTAYIIDHSPAASLFTDSPSPSADEPRTPDCDARWNAEVGQLCLFEEQIAYREYAG